MTKQRSRPVKNHPQEAALMRALGGLFDAAWYQARYPDIAAAGLVPLQHFIRHGLAESRDPNRFFDGAWYCRTLSGRVAPAACIRCCIICRPVRRNCAIRIRVSMPPGMCSSIRRPPPIRCCIISGPGTRCGYPTEKPIDIRDYLPSSAAGPPCRARVAVDVVIPVYRGAAGDPPLPANRCSPTPATAGANHRRR